MDRSEWIHRAGTLAMLVGVLIFVGAQLTPFDLAQRRGIGFGLMAATMLRGLYTWARSGWDAANDEADRDGGLMLLTLVICIILSVDY